MRLPEDYSGAQSDLHLVDLWLCGRPESTAKSYRCIARAFLKSLPNPLPQTTVADIVEWADSLKGSEGYQTQKIVAVKSLLTFAELTGYCVFNVGVVLRVPKKRSVLHERIVEPEIVAALIAAAPEGRDRALVRFLYASAARISEAMGLNWCDIGPGRVTLHGKGRKTRTVPVPQSVLDELLKLRSPKARDKDPVFQSVRGRRLVVRDAQRIVEKARGEVTTLGVSPHWMRHAHATHSLDNGAPLHKLQAQLGHSNISTTSVYLHVRPGEGTSGYLDL